MHESIRTALRATALLASLSSALISLNASAAPGAPGPAPGPGVVRAAPPQPMPRYYRHHRSHWHDWYWGPIALGGVILGTELYRNAAEPRVVEVPVPVEPVQTAPAAKRYAWYWCPSAHGYYPDVQTCPVEWDIVMGTSNTTPPSPAR